MKRLTRTTVFACGVVCAGATASAQVHPILERGFSPESAYQASGIDSINTFNGNLILSIPIGGTYPVGGRLSYQFTLAYNSSFWDNASRWDDAPPNCPRRGRCQRRRAIPTRFDTAGLGWRLSLGDLAAPHSRRNRSPNWLYVGPDGSRHAFVDTLHEGEPSRPDVWYTRDNTYLRLRQVEPPWSGGFPWMVVQGADGIEREFHFDGEDWRLGTIRDEFGNHLDIAYGDDVWTLTDSLGRTQRLYWTTVGDRPVIDRVELTAFGTSSPAVYQFSYAHAPEGLDIDESCVDRRLGEEVLRVALLTSLTLPDGSHYRMVDPLGDPAYRLENGYTGSKKTGGGIVRRSPGSGSKRSSVVTSCIPLSGVLERLIVPTGAVYQWTYGAVRYPNGSGGCTANRDPLLTPALQTSAGVTQRSVFLDSLDESIWTYQYSNPSDPEKATVTRTVTSPEGHDTVYFFNTEPCAYRDGSRVGWDGWAYGLPFDPTYGPHSDPSPSVEYYEGQGPERRIKRVRFVRYEHDQLPELEENSPYSWYDSNRRLAETRVLHMDDAIGPLQDEWASSYTRSSSFDGLGHYRRVERGGFGATDPRVEVTRYNPTRGTYAIDNNNNNTGSFTMLAPDEPWVLGSFDLSRQTEGAATAKQLFCFDAENGLLQRQRILRSGTTVDPSDLMTAFQYDPGGNLVAEHLHGGDREPLGTVSACGMSLPSPRMGLVHEYQHGVRRRTTHLGTSLHSLDVDVDWRTGLVSRSRDVAELATDWVYDPQGRVTSIAPDGSGRVGVQYVPASGDATSALAPARIDVTYRDASGASTLAAESLTFDALGRLSSASRLLPDDTWGTRHTEYTKGGLLRRVSEWTAEGASPVWTVLSDHDPFGRAGRITTPAGRSTDFTYAGDRVSTRFVSIGSGGTGATVTESEFATEAHRDHLGRLSDAWEPIGDAEDVHSHYEYDIGGRLSLVTVQAPEGIQSREFRYDNRGFLNWMRIPEKGPSGNGQVAYGSYDARGNAWSIVDGPNQLSYVWDAAGRLTRVEEGNGARLLEERVYGEANAGLDRKKGKLTLAVRHNYFDGVRDFRVEERYDYRHQDGRLSNRKTIVGVVGEDRERAFDQGFTWTDLGALASHSYPRHLFTAPPRTVHYEYTNGFVTRIPGVASAITYHPNGMGRRTVHENGVVDEQLLDPSGMARPGSIRSLYAIKDWTTGTFRYDGAGHIVGVGNDWYRYDGLGRVKEGTAWRSDGTRGRQTYGYDGFGNLRRIWTAGAGERVVDISSLTNRISGASYDAAGNQLSWGSGPVEFQYTHSPFNQIHLVSGGSPPVTRFHAYTADGERIASYASDTDVITHTFRDLEGRVVREYGQVSLDGTWSWKGDYIWGPRGLLVTTDRTDTKLHHHVDHLGSPRHVSHGNRFELARHAYYPFGEEATDPFADLTRMKFTGHERDLNLDGQTTDDLDYMHARFFNPNLGRFLSVDPLGGRPGRSQSFNRYAYALDDPVNLIDPRGLSGRGVFHGEITVTATPTFYGEITVTARAPSRRDLEWLRFIIEAQRRHQANLRLNRVHADPRREMLRVAGGGRPVSLAPEIEDFWRWFWGGVYGTLLDQGVLVAGGKVGLGGPFSAGASASLSGGDLGGRLALLQRVWGAAQFYGGGLAFGSVDTLHQQISLTAAAGVGFRVDYRWDLHGGRQFRVLVGFGGGASLGFQPAAVSW